MRVVTSVAGSIIMRVSADEVAPDRAVTPDNLITFLERTYGLSRTPIVPNIPQVKQQGPFLLQSGQFKKGNDEYPIVQVAIYGNGDVITAQNTDFAEIVLQDYIAQLDAELGYKFRNAKKTLTYLSNVVVQFDDAINKPLSIFGKLEKVLAAMIQRPDGLLQFKRLAFGQGDPLNHAFFPMNLDALDKADFVIERRTNEPYSDNKFFCSATLKTSDHVKVLEQIESVLMDG